MRNDRDANIASWVVVILAVATFIAVVWVLIATVRNISREAEQQAVGAERATEIVQGLVLEIRAQSRLNACLTLKLAKRHGVDTGGLDSPACKVFPNGAVIFPGEETGTLIDPPSAGSQGAKPRTPTPGQSPGSPPPQEPDPSPGLPPTPPGPPPSMPPNPPGPRPTCIDLPPPLEDVCLPVPPTP